MKDSKKRKLVLVRETLASMESSDLALAVGGQQQQPRPIVDATLRSAAASGLMSHPVAAVTSAVGASIDRASQRLGLPCWTVTTASIISRITR
jgi:hypothetical protein